MSYNKFTPQDIREMQHLKRMRIPMNQIAHHFDTTTPTIKYHTQMVAPMPIAALLTFSLAEAA